MLRSNQSAVWGFAERVMLLGIALFHCASRNTPTLSGKLKAINLRGEAPLSL
jgi:hypothetical protein